MDDVSIARIAHEVNREWCAFTGSSHVGAHATDIADAGLTVEG